MVYLHTVLLFTSLHFSAAQRIGIFGSFQVIEDQSLQIVCSSSIGSATSLSIRENGTAVMLPFHTINATHKTFFINVDKHDNGRRFTCENLGFQSIEKVLTVYYIDDYVFNRNPNVTLEENNSATINYSIQANPTNQSVLVRTDGRSVSDRITITANSIIFRRVNRTDAGQYQLSTTNQAGTAMAILVLQIEFIGIFSSFQVIEGETLQIFCSSSTGSATSLLIHENGTAVMLTFLTINATHKSFFINIDKHDNGRRFRCENSGFQSLEKVLTVYYIDDYVFNRSPNIILAENSSATINYSIQANPTNQSVLVRTDGRSVSDRIIITTESIIFRRVNRTDAGQYQLSTTNQAGTAMAILVLQIGQAPASKPSPGTIQASPTTVLNSNIFQEATTTPSQEATTPYTFQATSSRSSEPVPVIGGMFEVIEGQTLQITCSSHSVTNLHLYENGLALPILPIINDLQAHFLLSVTRSDNERRLRCGDSRVLSPEQEITVYYIDEYIFSISPNLTLSEGSNATVNYTIEANSINSSILMRTDGRPLSSRITVSLISIDYTGVNTDDAGIYQLSTTNEAGISLAIFTLQVKSLAESVQSVENVFAYYVGAIVVFILILSLTGIILLMKRFKVKLMQRRKPNVYRVLPKDQDATFGHGDNGANNINSSKYNIGTYHKKPHHDASRVTKCDIITISEISSIIDEAFIDNAQISPIKDALDNIADRNFTFEELLAIYDLNQ